MASTGTAGAEVLRMRQVDSTNVHVGHQEGAIHSSEDIQVTVDLRAKGVAVVAAKGARGEHNIYVVNGGTYNTDDKTTWATSWRGTWKLDKGSLALQLALDTDACSAVRDEDGAKTAKACERAASKRAALACTAESVEIEARAKKRKVSVWRCSPDDASELGESPSSWVFPRDGKTDKQRCLEVRAGRMMAISYAPCP